MANSSDKADYLIQLTWLRGFAAFLVLISHTIRATDVSYRDGEQALESSFVNVFHLGTLGVILFFTLSGTTLYISHCRNETSVLSFYIKRVLRIWPAYIVSLVVYVAYRGYFAQHYGPSNGHWIEEQFLADYSIRDVLEYTFLVFNFNGTADLFNNAYWSLPVEFQYYIFFPLALYLLKKVGPIGPIVLGGVFYFLYMIDFLHLNSSLVYKLAYSFFGGILLGWLYMRFKHKHSTLFGILLLVLTFILASLVTNEQITVPDLPQISDTMNIFVFVSFCWVYATLFCQFPMHRLLHLVLSSYGKISYSIYLYHNLVISLFVLLVIHMEIHQEYLRYFTVLIGSLVVTYILSYYSYKFIEKPAINLGRYLAKSVS